jgi:hypothetical protein
LLTGTVVEFENGALLGPVSGGMFTGTDDPLLPKHPATAAADSTTTACARRTTGKRKRGIR